MTNASVPPGSYRIVDRPDGSGISEGCITFFLSRDFYMVRSALLKAHRHRILQGDKLWAYGDVTVTGNISGSCDVTPG